jgi:hypothetical protein
VYYKCEKFHKNPISGLGGVALTRYMDEQTDGQGDSYIPSQTLFAGDVIPLYLHIRNEKLKILSVYKLNKMEHHT